MGIQQAFLLFEAAFCFMVSFFMALNVITADRKNLSNIIVMVGNFLAGLLLFSDFWTYMLERGTEVNY